MVLHDGLVMLTRRPGEKINQFSESWPIFMISIFMFSFSRPAAARWPPHGNIICAARPLNNSSEVTRLHQSVVFVFKAKTSAFILEMPLRASFFHGILYPEFLSLVACRLFKSRSQMCCVITQNSNSTLVGLRC